MVRSLLIVSVFWVACALFSFLHRGGNTTSKKPLYVRSVSDTANLHLQYKSLLEMREDDFLALIPPQSGFFFSGSPATTQGAGEQNNLSWDLSMGDKIKCNYTNLFLPNDQYPENGYVDIQTPTGKAQRFHYHQTAEGKKYWLEARRWFDQKGLMEQAAYDLARLFNADRVAYRECGRRSALILKRFAEVYPDYIIKYDYPGREKVFFDNAAYQKAAQEIDHYFIRLTRWSYWGYHDLSTSLLLAYDQLRGTDVLTDTDNACVVRMFEDMIAFVTPFEKVPLTNMHPTMWSQKAVAGNILGKQGLVDTAIAGVKALLERQFTYDGFWKEATVSYHTMTTDNLITVLANVYPHLEKQKLLSKIEAEYPKLFLATKGALAYRMPAGRYAAINDTHWGDLWGGSQPEPLAHSEPALMPAAGHSVLAAGTGYNQFQAHLGYSGWHGHNHYGSLGLIVCSQGKELISDIGYTLTRARTWSMTTAAHNTVVVDGVSQRKSKSPRAGLGNLLIRSTENPEFQVVEVRCDDVYPGHVTDYRRTLMTVHNGTDAHYVIDFFHVEGGQQHDWILHGSADEDQELEVSTVDGRQLSFRSQQSLLPPDLDFEELREQGGWDLIWKPYWAYGHFKNVQAARVSKPAKATFSFTSDPGKGLQTWLPFRKEHRVYKTKSWNVRGAREDQGKLDEHMRTSLIVRSEGGKSRFTAVHVPFSDSPYVLEVTDLSKEEEGIVVLKIKHREGIDYAIYRSDERIQTTSIEGRMVKLEGPIQLVQKTGFGMRTLTIRNEVAPLSSFTANSLSVKGALPAKPGHTAMIQHGDGQITAFQLDSVDHRHGYTTLFTRETVPFKGDIEGQLEMLSFPFLQLDGPHLLRVTTQEQQAW